ncbi:YkgJ family cysteine cluster protein [Peptococcaceae bacterium 1198_IL3148]
MASNNYFTATDKFKFSCHAGLACFNTCCRDISIFLTPYDVLRLKNQLKLTSDEFLQKYTHVIDTGPQRFPMIMINMMDQPDKRCPFVSAQGCSVYQNRPWSCRIAPVDIKGENLYGFCFDEVRCHGLKENREWTVKEWAENQGVDLTQKIEQTFNEIPKQLTFTGLASIDRHIKDMFMMVCYNLDRFRDYIFKSNFIEVFNVPAATATTIKTDDLELMEFGFNWLVNGFNIRKSIELRDQAFGG